MHFHPSLQSLLQLPSSYLDEQTIFRITNACPVCSSNIWVASESVICEGQECNWEAHRDLQSHHVAITYWIIDYEDWYLNIEVNYANNYTFIGGSIQYHIPTTLTPQEIQELLIWM